MNQLRSKWSMALGPITFHARESFTSSVLPNKREVVERMIWFLVPRPKGTVFMTSKEWAAEHVAEELCEHWIWCNIYPKHTKNTTKLVLSLYHEFKKLQATPKDRRTNKWVEVKVQPFMKYLEEGLDIRTLDIAYRKKQEEQHGVKETEMENAFWEDQMRGNKIGHCDGFVDRKWLAQDARRRKDQDSYQKRLENEKEEQLLRFAKVDISDEDFEDSNGYTEDCDYEMEEEEHGSNAKKRRRRIVGEADPENNQELPDNYKHIRLSVQRVRPEYYTALDRCISELHMSKEQAIGSTIIIAKELFNIIWKRFDDDKEKVDLDTVPDKRRIREVGRAREALALHCLVDKIMDSDNKTTITYHDDGSKKQGAGSFSVQGASIDGKFYPFPTLCLASETRENLCQMKLTILAILSTVSGVSSEEIWKRIDFTMTDSTTHNMQVDDRVAEALGTDHVPSHLLCQVHPACMFTRQLQKLCKQVDTTIGPSKIFSVFAVSLSDVNESVVEQWMDCLTRLVTHDFDHKSWNYSKQFDIFICPLKNAAKRLQKERFNSRNYTAMISLFLDRHVSEFLNKFTNITNSLACIVRSFEGLEYLRVLAAVIVIIGVQLVEPYLSLTTSSTTTWEKLVLAFPTLYTDLTSTKPELLLDLTAPAFSFISKERFKHCLYPSVLLQPTVEIIEAYRSDICMTLKILLPMMAHGWKQQRGEMFEFGGMDSGEKSTMIIKNFDQEKLQTAPVHNIDSERAVGSVNYGLKIRGNKQIKAVSSSMVKAGAAELLEGRVVDKHYTKLTKVGGAIPEILLKWEKEQADLKKKGMEAKEISNISVDKQRNSDLSVLTEHSGPFTKPEQVNEYFKDNTVSENVKNKRLYLEVRYAKNSSLSFPKVSEVFRLKRKGKNLASEEYTTNLATYLGKITCNVNMQFSDFTEALTKIGDA